VDAREVDGTLLKDDATTRFVGGARLAYYYRV